MTHPLHFAPDWMRAVNGRTLMDLSVCSDLSALYGSPEPKPEPTGILGGLGVAVSTGLPSGDFGLVSIVEGVAHFSLSGGRSGRRLADGTIEFDP